MQIVLAPKIRIDQMKPGVVYVFPRYRTAHLYRDLVHVPLSRQEMLLFLCFAANQHRMTFKHDAIAAIYDDDPEGGALTADNVFYSVLRRLKERIFPIGLGILPSRRDGRYRRGIKLIEHDGTCE